MLKEPNETHLGLSRGKSDGRGLGPEKARQIWQSFRKSKAVKSGLLSDLEDTVLLIDGVSVDILSDMITNIIRGPLITFTRKVCEEYGIPLVNDVDSGPVWNPVTLSWDQDYVRLPMPEEEKLILVPKSIVRIDMDYNVGRYYRHYVMERLKHNSSSGNQNSGWGGRSGAAVGSVVGGSAGSAVGGPFGGRVGAAGGGLAGYAIGDSIESGIRSGSSPDYGGYNAMGDYSGGPGTFGR